MDGVKLLNSHGTSGDFPHLIISLLDEFKASDFRSAERLLEIFQRQSRTISGYPRVRPQDCARVTAAIRVAFDNNQTYFRTGDRSLIDRFDTILDAYSSTDVSFYPSELFRTRLLQAEMKLLLNDFKGVRDAIGHFADRPYAVETDFGGMADLMWLDGQARLLTGDVKDLSFLFLGRVLMLTRLKPWKSWRLVSRFAPVLGLGEFESPSFGLFGYSVRRLSRLIVRLRRARGSWFNRVAIALCLKAALNIAGLCLFILRSGDLRWKTPPQDKLRRRSKEIIVTRAMGGIGDLLMMTPGLRGLAKRRKTRVKLLVSRKFFPIFENNPHVELVDIDGPPVDTGSCRAWFNLTYCPAGAYESRKRPFVKKGRVELFARGMGIGRLALNRYGWDIEVNLDENQLAFIKEFLNNAGFGTKPLIGIQPFSRDSYKDHPLIVEYINVLAADKDVILFHHVSDGLPETPSIVTTAGLSLSRSLALVSALDAMICVDSAFLHAAAAFDVPVIALFGPTDGKLFTRHHKYAAILDAKSHFACAPCWRNEDMACQLTNQLGVSPCIASIQIREIQEALAQALEKKK